MKTPVSIGALQLRRILETSLYADDLDQAEAFYKSVLGLNLLGKEAGRHLFFKLGDHMLLIFNPAKTIEESGVAPHGASGPGHIAFAVPLTELDQWRLLLQERGIQIEKDAAWPKGGRSLRSGFRQTKNHPRPSRGDSEVVQEVLCHGKPSSCRLHPVAGCRSLEHQRGMAR